MAKYKIGIIGGGAACVSLLYQLIDKIQSETVPATKFEIFIFEKSEKIGPGLAYGTIHSSHILNLNIQLMSPIPDNPNHFKNWLSQNLNKWQPEFPEVDIEKTEFPPRRLFGIYLNALAEELQSLADTKNIKVDFIYKEVEKIKPSLCGTKFHIKHKETSSEYIVNKVILCLGHQPSSLYTHLKASPNYLPSSWNSKQLNNIPLDQPIHIIGSRLTAIDTVLELISNGHTGKIYLMSRGGHLPCVIGPTQAYQRVHLTLENINRITADGSRKLKLSELENLFWQEIRRAEDNTSLSSSDIMQKLALSSVEWLEGEIKAAKGQIRPWQSVLASLYFFVPEIYNSLDKEGKKQFVNKYYSIWMTFLASFPLENAEKLLTLIKNQQVEVIPGLQQIIYDESCQNFIITSNNRSNIFAKYIINATGPGHDIKKSEVPLLNYLTKKKYIEADEVGGIKIDYKTLQTRSGLTILGDMTWGACMATADLGQVAKEATRIVNFLIEELQEEHNLDDSSSDYYYKGDKKRMFLFNTPQNKISKILHDPNQQIGNLPNTLYMNSFRANF